jgi:hypothetical protein
MACRLSRSAGTKYVIARAARQLKTVKAYCNNVGRVETTPTILAPASNYKTSGRNTSVTPETPTTTLITIADLNLTYPGPNSKENLKRDNILSEPARGHQTAMRFLKRNMTQPLRFQS